MSKLETVFTYFRFGRIPDHSKLNITWYVLEPDEDLIEHSRCFTQTELNTFINYTMEHPDNFFSKNVFACQEEENLPYCSINDGRRAHPENLIIRRKPGINPQGIITKCMDIILLNRNNNDNHNYNLKFDVIGRINGILNN